MPSEQKILINSVNKLATTTANVGREGLSQSSLIISYQDQLEVWNCRTKFTTKDITTDILLWGHPTFGIWNDQNWGSALDTSFILGQADNAILGTSRLGERGNPDVLTYVSNAHNVFPEFFENDRFFTGSSTGSWFEEEQYYELDNTEYFLSEYIAKEDKVYKSVKPIIIAELEDGTDASNLITAEAIIGSNTYSLTNRTTTNINNTGSDGMQVKFTNDYYVGSLTGTPFGETGLAFDISLEAPTFPEPTIMKLKEFYIKYSDESEE